MNSSDLKIYHIPDTDGSLHIAKNLKFNYRKYRSMLHFIYLNKESFIVNDNEVCAATVEVTKNCGRIVFKSRNLKFNYKDWKRMWEDVSKDEIFIQHVKEMLETPDIIEFLKGTLPCGVTRAMQDIMLFAETLKKCYDELNEKVNVENTPVDILEDYKKLENWLKNIKKVDPPNLFVPNRIYELAQKCAPADALNFAEVISYLIMTNRTGRLFQPYVWATLLEQFHDVEIELPTYKPLRSLVASEDFTLEDEISDEENVNDPSKSNDVEKQKQAVESVDQEEEEEEEADDDETILPRETRASLKRKCTEKLSAAAPIGAINSKGRKNQDSRRNQKQELQSERPHLAKDEPQATISIPLISGMIVEGLEFKVRVKSFRIQGHRGFEPPRSITWAPNHRFCPPEDVSNINQSHNDSCRVYEESAGKMVYPTSNSRMNYSIRADPTSEIDSTGGRPLYISDEESRKELHSKTLLHNQLRNEAKSINNEGIDNDLLGHEQGN